MIPPALLNRNYTITIPFGKIWWLIPMLFGTGAIVYALYYLLHTHEALLSWFLKPRSCIYRQDNFIASYFNAATKKSGNTYCVAAIVAGAVITGYSLYNWMSSRSRHIVTKLISSKDVLAISLLLLIAALLWTWGAMNAVPAYDEVFSALNCAAVPPFHTAAYYMLPNNHVLFNLANNVLFPACFDKVCTGRIISGIGYALLVPVLYYWLLGKTRHRGYAALYCTILMLQFPVWGFSFQARGYALYLLCAWTAAIRMECYLKSGEKSGLYIYTIASVAGFALLPSYLFWAVSLLTIQIVYLAWQRKLSLSVIKANVAIALACYLFYLPAITVSGLHALTDNSYVHAGDPAWKDFMSDFKTGFDACARYCFSGKVDGTSGIYGLLFAAPAVLWVMFRRTAANWSMALYGAAWIGFALLQLKLRHFPPLRNMLAHDSVTLAALLLSLHVAVGKFAVRMKFSRLIAGAVMSAFCGAMAVHFIRFMHDEVNHALYFYPAKWAYEAPLKSLQVIPGGAHVWCSDESFYPQYLLRRAGIDATHCMGDSVNFFITDKSEGRLPLAPDMIVEPVDSVIQYMIYRSKQK